MIIYKCSVCGKEFENTKEYTKHVCKGLPDPINNDKKKNKHNEYDWGKSTDLVGSSND